MKCINCNKTIPSSSIECPNCGKNPNMKDEVEFGDINNSVYDNNMNIDVPIKEKKKINIKLIIIASTVVVTLLILFALINSNKFISSRVYTKFVNEIGDKLDDILSATYQGKYDLNIDINDDKYKYNGEYSFDLSKRYATLTGNLSDPNKTHGAVLLEDKDLSYEILFNELALYLKSENINSDVILVPLDNYGLYLNKRIDYESILNGVRSGLIDALNVASYNTSQENYKYNNKNTKVNKTELVLNNKSIYRFEKKFYESLIDDASFISEISKITKKTEEEIVNTMNNYIKNAEYAQNENDKEYKITIYSNKYDIYEINFNDLVYYKNVNNIYSIEYKDIKLTIRTSSEEHQDYIQNDFNFDLNYGKNNINGLLKLKENIEPNLNKLNYDAFININELTNKDIIKSNINYYFKNSKWFDIIDESVSEKCTKGLTCKCDDNTTCTCMYNDKMIKCEYELVN